MGAGNDTTSAAADTPDRASHGREDLKGTTYEFFILAISILSIVNLGLATVLTYGSQPWLLVAMVDAALTAIFVWDFVFRLTTSPRKLHYLGRGGGVFDLLGCLPGLRIFRLFRIVRAVRVTRRLGGPRVLTELRGALAAGTLYLVVFLGIVTLEIAGLLELRFEENTEGANITTAGDALWWGYVTATTVGYGDQFPVTPAGRVVGVLMLTVGVALFATFSGFLANLFLSAKNTRSAPQPAAAGADDLAATLREVESLHAAQKDVIERLREQIAELERAT